MRKIFVTCFLLTAAPAFAQQAEKPAVAVPEPLIQATVAFLATRPYADVYQLIDAWRQVIQQSAQPAPQTAPPPTPPTPRSVPEPK